MLLSLVLVALPIVALKAFLSLELLRKSVILLCSEYLLEPGAIVFVFMKRRLDRPIVALGLLLRNLIAFVS